MCLLPFGLIHMNVDRHAPILERSTRTGHPQDLALGCERESRPRPVAAVPTHVSPVWFSVSPHTSWLPLPPESGDSGQDCSGAREELHRADLQRPKEQVKETRG